MSSAMEWSELPAEFTEEERRQVLCSRWCYEKFIDQNKQSAYKTYIDPAYSKIMMGRNKEEQLLFCESARRSAIILYDLSREYDKRPWMLFLPREKFYQKQNDDLDGFNKEANANVEKVKQATIEYINAEFDKIENLIKAIYN